MDKKGKAVSQREPEIVTDMRGLLKCVAFLLPFDEYFIKFWYPHLQRFQRSSDNCGKIHVRIILGHPIRAPQSGCWVKTEDEETRSDYIEASDESVEKLSKAEMVDALMAKIFSTIHGVEESIG